MINIKYYIHDKFGRYVHNGIVQIFSANVFNNIIQMLSLMLVTRLLTKSDYGVLSFSINVYSYLELISGFGLLSGAFQYATENHGNDNEFRYIKYCLRIGVIINTFIVLAFEIAMIFINISVPSARFYIRILAPLLVLNYLISMCMTMLRCDNLLSEYARLTNINAVLNAVGMCIGSIYGISGVIFSKYMASIITIFLLTFVLKGNFYNVIYASSLQYSCIKPLWHYSIATGFSSTLNCLLYLLDITMVGSLTCNAEQVAIYKVATLIPTALGIIPNSIMTAVTPQIIYNRDNCVWLKNYVKHIFCFMLYINIAICGLLMIFAKYVIVVISGKEYVSAVPIFRILILGYCISGTFRILSTNILAVLKQVNCNLAISIVSGLCDIIFNYFLIYKYHTIGASYATLLVQIISSVMSFSFLYYRIYGKNSEE